MLKRFRLKTQVVSSFSLVIAIIIISGCFSLGLMIKTGSLADSLLKIDRIKIFILEARRHEKNFLIRKDRISIEKVHELLDRVRTLVDAMNSDNSDTRTRVFFDRILAQLDLYELAFDAVVSNVTAREHSLDESMTQSMVILARDILNTCSELESQQHPLMKRLQVRALIILAVNTAFSALICFAMALLIGRGIIGPIRRCAAFAQAIAKGELNQTLDVVSAGSTALLAESLKDMLNQLKRRIGFMEGILNGLPVPCSVIDTHDNISFISQPMLDYLEIEGDTEQYIGMPWATFAYGNPDRETRVVRAIQQKKPETNLFLSLTSRRGSPRHARIDIALLEDMDENPMGGFVVLTDLTRIKEEQDKLFQAHRNLKSKSQELELVLHTIENQVWYVADNRYLFANHARSAFLGKTCEELQGKNVHELIPREEADQVFHYTDLVMTSKQKHTFEMWSINHTNEYRLLSLTKVPKLDCDGHVEFIVTVAQDITEQRKLEEQLRYKSYHDQLTGLYNRHFLMEEIERLQKGRFFPLGVIFCDLDDLKVTNDTLGHEFGDKLIIKVAKLMKISFRASDIVARYGGDEFVVILPKSNACDMENAIKRFREEVDACNNAHKRLPVKISMGFAVSTNKSDSIINLLKSADSRMYQAKKMKKDSP